MVSTRSGAAGRNDPPPLPRTPPQKKRGRHKKNKQAAEASDIPETRATDIEDATMADVMVTDGARVTSGGGHKGSSNSRSERTSKRKLDETESEVEAASEAPTGDIVGTDDEMSELSSLDEPEPPVELTPKPASKPPRKRVRGTSPGDTPVRSSKPMVNTTHRPGASKGKQTSVGGPAGAALSFKMDEADLAAWMSGPNTSTTKAGTSAASGLQSSSLVRSSSSQAHPIVPSGTSRRASRTVSSENSSSLPSKNVNVARPSLPYQSRTKAVPPPPPAKPPRPDQKTPFKSVKPKTKKKIAVESGDEEPERAAALSSPPKGSARPTSTHVIKIKEEPASPRPAKLSISVIEPTPRKRDDKDFEKRRDKTRGRSRKGKQRAASESENDESSDIEILENPPQTLKPPRSQNESRSRSRSRSRSQSASRSSRTWRLEDIPEPAQSRWRSHVLPILLRFQGARRDPWVWFDPLSVKSLQMIWDAVYGDEVPHKVVCGDCVHGFANQSLYNWRSLIRAAAESVVGMLFQENPGINSLESRAAFSSRILEDKRYLFEEPFNSDNKRLFRSKLFLSILACHLDATKNAADVPGLFNDKTIRADCPIGAWGLAAAALERVFKLFAKGLMQPPVDKKGNPSKGLWVVIPQVNPKTGKLSKSQTRFCEPLFSSRTTFFITSADAMTSNRFNGVLAAAEAFMSHKRTAQDALWDDGQDDSGEELLQDGDSD